MPKEKGRSSMQLTPYLLFDGTCKKAMEFYHSVLGGNLAVTQVKNSPASEHMQAFQQEKVVNAHLESGVMQIPASDWLMLDKKPNPGNTVCLYLSGGTLEELTSLFEKLSAGADVTNPLQPTFFGTYGALNDRFGVRWMFVCKNAGN
ncbi:MAG: VOC family protein [Acidobacteriota bacterium]|nr:VOC family protein [Acidobacteriota bacterium]